MMRMHILYLIIKEDKGKKECHVIFTAFDYVNQDILWGA